MENINTTCHRILKSYCTKDMIAVDATAGNGNDTYFLCTHCHHVYAYDIQIQAIENTKERCKKFDNLTLFNKSHEEISLLNQPLDIVMFNFGYLPHCNSSIITKQESSLIAIEAAFQLLNTEGILTLTCYTKHPGGASEHDAIRTWLNKQLDLTYTIYHNQQLEHAPILYVCTKRKRT